REALPAVPDAARERAGDLIMTTMTAVGKAFSEAARTEAETEAYAEGMADMFCVYLGEMQSECPRSGGTTAPLS
ncbi:hypothetical protein KC221_24455, partial [Mycobacterium tuberculosis]|nr:hypothetical protein [Mycobacterium tuberculosis]